VILLGQSMRKRFATAFLSALSFSPILTAFGIDPTPTPDPNLLRLDLDSGAVGLSRALAQLRTRASILMVTAHPDDEDGGLLAYQTRQFGARGALMSLTRGEGGQNAVSPDMYDALALIRTQELLAATRYYGTDLYWGTVIDYGFSKTREEAIEKWGYERVLGDVVRVIRLTRPLIVTSVWAGAPTDGHGNHQVAGQMAQEAFAAAGDPTRFPEQIREGLRPWKPLKMYARVPFFQPTPKGIYDYATDKYVPVRFFDYINKTWIEGTPSTDIEIPEGVVQPASGLTSSQIARTGLGFEKSQNGGFTTPPAVPVSLPYHRYSSRVPVPSKETSLYDGIDTSLPGIATLVSGNTTFLRNRLTRIAALIEQAASTFRPSQPEAIAPLLADGLKQLRALTAETDASSLAEPGKQDVLFELRQKDLQFQNALVLALHASFEALTSPEKDPTGPFAAFAGPQPVFQTAIPGQSFFVKAHLYDAGAEPIQIDRLELASTSGKDWQLERQGQQPANLAPGKDVSVRFSVHAPADAKITEPYFTRPDEEQPFYNLRDAHFHNLSTAPYPLVATVQLRYRDVEFAVSKYVLSMERIEGIGPQAYPLTMSPAISIQVSPAAGAVPLECESFAFTVTLRSNVKKSAAGTLKLQLPEGWTSAPSEFHFTSPREGDTQTVTFHVEPRNMKAEAYSIKAMAEYDGHTYESGYKTVGYPGLTPSNLYRQATYRAVGVDVKTPPGLKVAYIPGTGDDVARALEDLGLSVRILSPADVEKTNLSEFGAIVLGVRAYSQPGVRAQAPALHEYVKNGGTLVVQYNTQDFEAEAGPYSLTLGNSPAKVVDEGSAVKFLDPANPLFQWPNKITEHDFSNWQEERGHGFAQKWDNHYTALVETHDPEQEPQSGGLLMTHYGKGVFIYDAFALYRQLPTGVPGAYRILANLVSAGQNPDWNKK
jgi:LmbE family N-acetylglucosaminyl deacetylase